MEWLITWNLCFPFKTSPPPSAKPRLDFYRTFESPPPPRPKRQASARVQLVNGPLDSLPRKSEVASSFRLLKISLAQQLSSNNV